MEKRTYQSLQELPLMLSMMDVASVLGISKAGAYTVRFHPSPQSEAVSGRRRPEHFKGISENRRSPFYFSHTHTAPPGCGSEADVSDASPPLENLSDCCENVYFAARKYSLRSC